MFSMIQAASMGLPYIAVRGLLGSDILKHRQDLKVEENPFNPGEKIVVAQPIRPDVAVFHALKADRWGNAVTAPGITPANVHREGGPTKVVTPKAILTWERQNGGWLLEAVHPGSSVEEVRENTGFELAKASSFRMTPPPTGKELTTLREAVREKLKRIYPDVAEKKIQK
jgi:acyl CoA:acetate/3-ketoacid CoA transferase alpha subunit